MKSIPIGKDNFQKLIQENCYYVDKTASIEELLENGSDVVLYTRPRRFGKSLFISMLEHFFDIDKKEINKDLFKGLYISQSPYYKELSNYPVINLDFKDLKRDDFDSTYEEFKNIIADVYEKKTYLLDYLSESQALIFNSFIDKTAKKTDYERTLKYLSNWLEEYHHQKVIILIDEYDVPIQYGYLKGFYDEIVSLIRSVFSSCLKGNDSLKFGVLTGVLRVSKESIFSDLNNPDVIDMMTPTYNEAFGFTEKETKELLEYYGLELTKEVKNNYDGYNIGGVSIYNPWSILSYASKKVIEPYWINTSSNDLIKDLLSKISEEDKIEVEKLLQGESISFTYNKQITYLDFHDSENINSILSLMFMSGYLTFDKNVYDEITKLTYKMYRIPNEEVRSDLIEMIQKITFQKVINQFDTYKNFTRALILDNKNVIEEYINKLLASISYYDKKESFYHGYIIGLLGSFISHNYIVKSNREAGKGRFDVLIESVDRTFGCIMEFKISDKESEMENMAKKAKKQMKEKGYYKELQLDKVANIHEYALVFCGKKCIVR